MTDTTETPLVYTSKGNLPVASLLYKTSLIDHQVLNIKLEIVEGKIIPVADKDGHMEFVEEYYTGSEEDYNEGLAELVKRNVHILRFKGLDMRNEQGNVS